MVSNDSTPEFTAGRVLVNIIFGLTARCIFSRDFTFPCKNSLARWSPRGVLDLQDLTSGFLHSGFFPKLRISHRNQNKKIKISC
jgi:hypothetical protein